MTGQIIVFVVLSYLLAGVLRLTGDLNQSRMSQPTYIRRPSLDMMVAAVLSWPMRRSMTGILLAMLVPAIQNLMLMGLTALFTSSLLIQAAVPTAVMSWMFYSVAFSTLARGAPAE